MKASNLVYVVIALVIVLGAALTIVTETAPTTPAPFAEVTTDTAISVASSKHGLSPQEIAGLQFMREEEKLARDVYQTLGAKWGTQVFPRISSSEQVHTESVKTLIEKYGIKDPMLSEPGRFVDQGLQTAYDELVVQGMISRLEAFRAGAYIEELDIRDLDVQMLSVTHGDIRGVYEHLRQGSENHLRAFSRQISRESGAAYLPQLLAVSEYQTIIGN